VKFGCKSASVHGHLGKITQGSFLCDTLYIGYGASLVKVDRPFFSIFILKVIIQCYMDDGHVLCHCLFCNREVS